MKPPKFSLRGVTLRGALALAAVVVVLVVLVRAAAADSALAGYWTAHSAFLAESGLSQLSMYLPAASGLFRRRREGYLAAVDADGVVVANGPIDVTHGPLKLAALRSVGRSPRVTRPAAVRFRVGAEADEPNALEIIPDGAEFRLDAAEGTLRVSDGGRLHAYFVRDNEVSLAANDMFASGLEAEAGSEDGFEDGSEDGFEG